MEEKNTPLMQQYFAIKDQYPDALLFFQVGDFYELFFDDAKTASAFLAIALTKRGKNKGEDIPLCGIPVHALNHYLVKLIKGGFHVALCAQLSKPQPGTVVQRGVTHVFTPGTLTETAMLDDKSASYLLSFYQGHEHCGLLFAEILTAQLFATVIPTNEVRTIESELVRFFPDEIIINQSQESPQAVSFFKRLGYYTNVLPDIRDDADDPHVWIAQQFNEKTQATIQSHDAISGSMQTMYRYLKRHQSPVLSQFNALTVYHPNDYLVLDATTQKNLELVKNTVDGGTKNTLFSVLDRAKTSMGSRTIKKWITRPLIEKKGIVSRQQAVCELKDNVTVGAHVASYLGHISDLERIIGRIALLRATIHDYRGLNDSLAIIPAIKKLLSEQCSCPLLKAIEEKMFDVSPLANMLSGSLETEGERIIKKGCDLGLDALRDVLEHRAQAIATFEAQEREKTGISSLKVECNNITGYYLEITNPNLEKVPASYQELQKLVNRKRFTTPELHDLERAITKAQNDLEATENAVFERIKNVVYEYVPVLRSLAYSVAYLDALYGLSVAAAQNNYVAPVFTDHVSIVITGGRHPTVEQSSSLRFIPNDTRMDETQKTWIITGPNMGGKSTYLRQVALISVMAQMGSLVPAVSATLPVLDRIFTRIGSGDNLAEGKSTFLVEMEETAAICRQATSNSLVILDEVGRGTSTYDGISLAQAIVEYITQTIKPYCLFATHFHELTVLPSLMPGIANYHMMGKKQNNTMIFLYTMMPGVAGASFGLDVARLADMPESIIKRAAVIHEKLISN